MTTTGLRHSHFRRTGIAAQCRAHASVVPVCRRAPRKKISNRTTPPARRGFTLAELAVSVVSTSVLIAGIASSIYVASQAATPSNAANVAVTTSLAVAEIAADLATASSFKVRTNSSVAITVADRDANGADESIRYSWDGQPSGQLMRYYNGVATSAATNVYNFSLAYSTQSCPNRRRVLFVQGNVSGSQAAYDASRRILMKGWGYTVIPLVVDPATSQIEIDAMLATVYAVYVSATVNSADVGTKLKNSTAGVLIEKGALFDSFGLSTVDGSTFSESRIEVKENGHYITSPFPIGALTILTANQDLNLVLSTRAADIQLLGDKPGSGTNPSLTVLDGGGVMADSTRATGPRVTLPWGSDTFDPVLLTSDGQAIWRRALEWVTGEITVTAIDVLLQIGPTSTGAGQTRIELVGRPLP